MTAKTVYVDPSALAKLYLHQPGSREMATWRSRTPSPLPVTHHGRIEVTNAICRTAFLGYLDREGLNEALDGLEFEAIMSRLERSCRTFRMGPTSRNYVAALRQTLGRA